MPRVPILMYHRIGKAPRGSLVPGHYVAPALFRRHMTLLRALWYRTVSLDQMAAGLQDGSLPERTVVITFDDGYRSFYDSALPILRETGFKATVFLVSDLIGKENAWDLDKGDKPEPLMSREQILEAAKAGVEFGSHSKTHAELTAIEPERAWCEISESKSDLESNLGLPIRWFCYPYGAFDGATREMVQRAGYVGACATGAFANGPEADRFALGRINVRKTTSAFRLSRKLAKSFREEQRLPPA